MLSVQDAFLSVAQGDTGKLEEFRKIGKLSEDDHLMPAIIRMMEVIQDLVNEAKTLGQAGINGNLTLRGDARNFEGGYRDIVERFNSTLDAIIEPVQETEAVMQELAKGNLRESMMGDYRGDFAVLKEAINAAIDAFNNLLADINNAAAQVASGSEQISASVAEIAGQTKQNATNANQANDLALLAKENAIKGNAQMQDMVKAMDAINESSGNIGKIIKVIDEIAFQTNILALNAAVEAARAGTVREGFCGWRKKCAI